jgi:predicted PurR-regulated permease PerM
VLLSLLLATTMSPLPIILSKRGLGRGTAIAITVLLAVVGGVALLMVLARSIGRLSENLPAYQASLANLLDGLEAKMAARGMPLDEALKPDPARFMARVGGLLSAALGLVFTGLLSLVLIVLFLIELPLLKEPEAGASRARQQLDEAGRLVRRFIGLNGLVGAVIAVIDLVIMWLLGTDAAVLWAVIAFLFAFVPFGFLISLIPPFLITLLEQGMGRAALLFGLFFVVNFIGDNVIKPKVMGGGLGLSPLVIVLALLGWGVVLGPMGALLAIPLTLTLKQVIPLLVGEKVSAPPL